MIKEAYVSYEIAKLLKKKDGGRTMTYEERKKWLCEQCNHKNECAYVRRNMEYKCLLLEERMGGWELGYKDAIDKVCELIFEYNKGQARKFGAKSMMRLPDYTINVGDFRKAMEE